MKRTRLSDLPPHVRERVLAQMGRDPKAEAQAAPKPPGKARRASAPAPLDPRLLEAAGRARAYLDARGGVYAVLVRPEDLGADPLSLLIPGEPHAQGRARFQVRKMRRPDGSTFMRPVPEDDPSSAAWKAAVRVLMEAERVRAGWPLLDGLPFRLTVIATWSCLEGRVRLRTPAPERWKATRPDADNVVKAVLDAGNGLLWKDDGAAVEVVVRKREAAQGALPGTVVRVEVLPA